MPKNAKDIKDKIKLAVETYNKIDPIYKEQKENKLLQFQLTEFVSMIPKGAKILDAGCGTGRDSKYLKEDGLEVVSIDLADGMIKEAKESEINVKKEDLLKIKYK